MAKELESTILIDNEEYNLNAKTAERTGKKLVAKRIHLFDANGNPNTAYETADFFDFDGSIGREPVLVPAAGGRFKGRITVPDVSADTLKKDAQTVLNYRDIVSKVVDTLLNTSTTATWLPEDTSDYQDPNTDTELKGDEADVIDMDADEIEALYNLTFTGNDTSVNGICVVVGPGKNNEILYFTKYNYPPKPCLIMMLRPHNIFAIAQ